MKTSTKFWLGIFTFLPLFLTLAFIAVFFSIFFENIIEINENHQKIPFDFLQSVVGLILSLVVLALFSLGIKIYYIVHTSNNILNDSNKKIMWILILIFTGSIGSIIYYFVEIISLKNPNQLTS